MSTIKSLSDLEKLKEKTVFNLGLAGNSPNQIVQIKVGMATCGIASGAKAVMDFLIEECDHQALDAKISKTGCLGYCYAEPTVEVKIPGKDSVIFGYVDKLKAQEIIEKYIMKGESVSGKIDITFKTIDE